MKHRSLWPRLLLSWLLLGAPALAQDTTPGREQSCRDLLADLARPYLPDIKVDKVTAKANGGCLYAGLLSQLKWTRLSIESVDVDRIEPDPAGRDRPPLALRLSVSGLRISGAMQDDAAMSYMMQVTQAPLALSLDYERDIAKDVLKVNAFTFNTPHGALGLSTELTRFDPLMKTWSPNDLIMRTALKSLEFSLRDEEGEIQRLLALPIGYNLLRGSSDPAARMAELKQQGASWLRLTLGLMHVPKDTIEETIAALMELPKATKPFYLSIKLPEPVGVEDIFRVMVGGTTPGTLFPEGSIIATYGK